MVRIEVPAEVARYVVEKGSITLDGVSLTVAARERAGFAVALIPGPVRPGAPVTLTPRPTPEATWWA